MENIKQFGSSGCLEAWPKIFLWNALCLLHFYMDCWTVNLIAVLMISLWPACFIFLWWFFVLKNLLEAVCKCNLFCIAKVCLFLTNQSENLHQNITWLQRIIIFSLVCLKGQWTFVKPAIFISKTQLIPSWKSCPNPLHIFAKLRISSVRSKRRVLRWAWLLNFRWNRSPKRGHGFSRSGANWLKANLGIVVLS